MAFWRLYYHFSWATKNRLPLITQDIEEELYGYISRKINSLRCIPHAIGGIEDHIHIVVSIPPKLSIAEFVKHVKGSSSHHMNKQKPFQWQRSYGVFSLGSKQLDTAIEYVSHQKERHERGDIINALETLEDEPKQLDNNQPA